MCAYTRARARTRAPWREEVPVAHLALGVVPGDPLAEPAFIQQALGKEGWLVLDLHNVHTMAVNLGFEPEAYLARLDLDRVLELHISGGTYSEPGWLPSRRSLRLDSHDSTTPEPVWSLLESVWPRCKNLRGVTLERMEGTVGEADVVLIQPGQRVRLEVDSFRDRKFAGHVTQVALSAKTQAPGSQQEAKQLLGLTGLQVIGVVATIRSWKGHRVLIEALKHLSPQTHRFTLLNSPYMPNISQKHFYKPQPEKVTSRFQIGYNFPPTISAQINTRSTFFYVKPKRQDRH